MIILAIILTIISILILLRLLLPSWMLNKINTRLAKSAEYKGRVERLSLSLLNQKVKLHSVRINKLTPAGAEIPFFTASSVIASIQFRSLLKKIFKADILIEEGQIIITSDKKETRNTDSITTPFNLKNELTQMMPFVINLQCVKGKGIYLSQGAKGPVNLELTDLEVTILNLTNIDHNSSELPARVSIGGSVYGGKLTFEMKLDPLNDQLTFDMNTKLEKVSLPLMNDFLRSYAGLDVSAGTFEMYMEVAAREGEFNGYIKPIIRDLDVISAQDKDDKFFTRLWEGLVAGAYQLLKNKSEDQVATKIQIKGKLDDPHINIFSGIVSILKNAFIHALKPTVEDVINLNTVKATMKKSGRFVKDVLGI